MFDKYFVKQATRKNSKKFIYIRFYNDFHFFDILTFDNKIALLLICL